MARADRRRCRWVLVLTGLVVSAGCTAPQAPEPLAPATSLTPAAAYPAVELYPVVSVADGDTITVSVDGVEERIRLIGIDSPELHRPVECFGRQAADEATELLAGAAVRLIADPTQDDRDRYGRLLRYVELPDGTDVNAALLRAGYAFEFTYDKPYERQELFREQEAEASEAAVGLWSPVTCGGRTTAGAVTGPSSGVAPATSTSKVTVRPDGCVIKGNINRRGERIYHLPGDSSYDETVINTAAGERYFCTATEAEENGWRAAGR